MILHSNISAKNKSGCLTLFAMILLTNILIRVKSLVSLIILQIADIDK